MSPGLILDQRADLLRRTTEDNDFREQLAWLLASQMGEVPAGQFKDKKLTSTVVARHMASVDSLARHLTVAEVYRVTEEMSSMVSFAASQLDDTDLVNRDLAPTPTGLVRFDKPLLVKDIRGQTMLVHWMTWGPYADQFGRPVTVVWSFNDPLTEPDMVHLSMMNQARERSGPAAADWYARFIGRFATIGASFMFDGNKIGSMEALPSKKQVAELLEEGREPLPGTNDLRYLHTLWLLLGQTITRVEDESVDRPSRRRAGKAKLPSRVTVIRLRREVSPASREPGESLVEWQHRWFVRGHWRWQPYGSHNPDHAHTYGKPEVVAGSLSRPCTHGDCDARVTRIYIHPFEKGPEGAPLIQSEKVYNFDR